MTTTVTKQIRFAIKGRHKRAVCTPRGEPRLDTTNHPIKPDHATYSSVGRIPRVARLMALAIKYDQLLKDGIVESQSELAHLAQITQPRMTQIMNLLHLSPEIQEEILFLQGPASGRDPITERDLRCLTHETNWAHQMLGWERLKHDIAVNITML